MSVTVPPVGVKKKSLDVNKTQQDPVGRGVVVVVAKVEGVGVTAASLESHTLAHISTTPWHKKGVIVLLTFSVLFISHRLERVRFCFQ